MIGENTLFGGYSENVGLLGDTWRLAYRPGVAPELCLDDVDDDGDGLVGCDDDECWRVCTPGVRLVPIPRHATGYLTVAMGPAPERRPGGCVPRTVRSAPWCAATTTAIPARTWAPAQATASRSRRLSRLATT